MERMQREVMERMQRGIASSRILKTFPARTKLLALIALSVVG